MPLFAWIILIAGYVAWMLPFFIIKRNKERPNEVDRRARWGVILQMAAYGLVWSPGGFWAREPGLWRVMLSVFCFGCAAAFSWSGALTLGKQWRIDAGLNADHALVRSGVYGLVRHPIYTSMLCLLLGAGFMITPWPLFAGAIATMVVGTEIRVRIEERLLAARFGSEFMAYKCSVGAYVPLLK